VAVTIIRLCCEQHSVLATASFERDDENPETIEEGALKDGFVDRILVAHRAEYGGQCPASVLVERFDGARPPVQLIWYSPAKQDSQVPVTKLMLAVAASVEDAHQYIASMDLPRTMVLTDGRVRVGPDDIIVEEAIVVHYLEEPRVDPEREEEVSDDAD
jgi:hypothetical protein